MFDRCRLFYRFLRAITMGMINNCFWCAFIGYLIGGLNPAALISWFTGADIRHKGSGNVGASNALMVMGKTVGIFCALFDVMKSFLVVKITLSKCAVKPLTLVMGI